MRTTSLLIVYELPTNVNASPARRNEPTVVNGRSTSRRTSMLRRSPLLIAEDMSALGMAGTAEHPVRLDDLERPDGLRRQTSGRQIDPVQVPPLVAVGDDDEGSIPPPEWLLECLVAVADELASGAHRCTVEISDPPSSVDSHGMFGCIHWIHTTECPSGDSRGAA